MDNSIRSIYVFNINSIKTRYIGGSDPTSSCFSFSLWWLELFSAVVVTGVTVATSSFLDLLFFSSHLYLSVIFLSNLFLSHRWRVLFLSRVRRWQLGLVLDWASPKISFSHFYLSQLLSIYRKRVRIPRPRRRKSELLLEFIFFGLYVFEPFLLLLDMDLGCYTKNYVCLCRNRKTGLKKAN